MNIMHRCPVCFNTKTKQIYELMTPENWLYIFGTCKICGYVFQYPFYSDEHYHSLGYDSPQDYVKHAENRTAYINSFIFQSVRDKINDSLVNTEEEWNNKFDILDIGAGKGLVLLKLKEKLKSLFNHNNFISDAVTLHAEQLIYKNDNNYQIDFEHNFVEFKEITQDKKYDLIILSHTLEHFKNPVLVLNNIHKILKEDGLLYIEVPSLYKTEVRTSPVFTPVHMSYFSKTSLKNTLVKSNFKIVKLKDSNYWGNIKCVCKKTNYTIKTIHFEKFVKLKYILSSVFKNPFYSTFSKFKRIGDND